MRRVVVICPHGLGNMVLVLPALMTLRHGFDDLDLTFVSLLPSTTRLLTTVVPFTSLYDRLEEVRTPRSLSSLVQGMAAIRRLRATRPDVSLVTFPTFRPHYHILARLIGAPQRVAPRHPDDHVLSGTRLETDLVPVVEGLHDSAQNLRLVERLGSPSVVHRDLSVTRELFPDPKEPLIGIHPGCKRNDSFRAWPIERYTHLVRHILDNHPAHRIALFLGPDEVHLRPPFDVFGSTERFRIVAGSSLEEDVRLLARCSLFVGSESGLTHLAALTHCPRIVSLVGPTDPRRTAPQADGLRMLSSHAACAPCWHTYLLSSRRLPCAPSTCADCIDAIGTDQVTAAVDSALDDLAHAPR